MALPGKRSDSVGIRNRVNHLSDSMFDLLSSSTGPGPGATGATGHTSVDSKTRPGTTRPAAILLSRVVVYLFLLSLALIALAVLRDTAVSLAPLRGALFARGHAHASKRGDGGAGLSAYPAVILSVSDYPAVLVDDSPPFNPVPRPDTEAGVVRDDNAQSIIVTAHSEDEVSLASKDKDVTSDAGDDTAARLIVITMDRAKSLRRLLDSLVRANYGEDVVDLDVWIDKPSDGSPLSAEIISICRNLTWRQGTKTIHKRTINAGLYKQWIYTWNITAETTEFAVILEDDLEVSPAFYQWLRVARAAYAQDPDVAAFTLQRSTLRPRQRKGFASGNLKIPADAHVFKYRLLGTWGFAPQRDQWVEFRKWFEAKRARNEKPYVDGLVTTDWYKQQEKDGFAPNMWSQWWIKFVDEKNYFTITAHLPDGTTLAANWRESGLHYSKNEPKADFSVYRGSGEQFMMPDNPIVVDWDGLIIHQKATVNSTSRNATLSA